MATDFTGRLIAWDLKPCIVIPKAIIEEAGIAGEHDVRFIDTIDGGNVYIGSKSGYSGEEKVVGDESKKEEGE